MNRFPLFLLSFLANVVVINAIPEELTKTYLNTYNLLSAIFALSLFLVFCRHASIRAIRRFGFALLALFAIAHFFLSPFWATIIAYPGLLIFNDYASTQTNKGKWQQFYRLYLICSALPLLIPHSPETFSILFQIRAYGLAVICLAFLALAQDAIALAVRSTWSFIVVNYSSYYGALLLLSNTTTDAHALKVWYICCQGGLVLYLKLIDYNLRHQSETTGTVTYAVLLVAVAAPIPAYLLFPSPIAVIVYFFGLGGLVYSRRLTSWENNV